MSLEQGVNGMRKRHGCQLQWQVRTLFCLTGNSRESFLMERKQAEKKSQTKCHRLATKKDEAKSSNCSAGCKSCPICPSCTQGRSHFLILCCDKNQHSTLLYAGHSDAMCGLSFNPWMCTLLLPHWFGIFGRAQMNPSHSTKWVVLGSVTPAWNCCDCIALCIL